MIHDFLLAHRHAIQVYCPSIRRRADRVAGAQQIADGCRFAVNSIGRIMPTMADPGVVPRIAFNAALLSPSGDYRAAGIHRHIAGLVTALAQRDDLSLTVFATAAAARASLPPGIDVRPVPTVATRPAGRILWEQLALPRRMGSLGPALLHAPAYAMPVATTAPTVVTVHDLSFFRLPDTLGQVQGPYLRAATRWAVSHARAIIAVSDFTRRELMSLVGAPSERIHVVPNGIDANFARSAPDAIARFRDQAGLPERFILAVGTLQPRKNLAMLVAAYADLRATMPAAPDLVIAGAPGWGPDEVARRTTALGLDGHVHRPGYVNAGDLPLLYSAATLLAFPSRYEGFGLPLIEAMACGTPVIIADAASLPEVAGEAALCVSPDDSAAWSLAMQTVLGEEGVAAQLAAAGPARAARFTWDRAASQTADVYRTVIEPVTAPTRRLEVTHRGA
jgi:glycosyltransferase involved in cell wall biosynthesis